MSCKLFSGDKSTKSSFVAFLKDYSIYLYGQIVHFLKTPTLKSLLKTILASTIARMLSIYKEMLTSRFIFHQSAILRDTYSRTTKYGSNLRRLTSEGPVHDVLYPILAMFKTEESRQQFFRQIFTYFIIRIVLGLGCIAIFMEIQNPSSDTHFEIAVLLSTIFFIIHSMFSTVLYTYTQYEKGALGPIMAEIFSCIGIIIGMSLNAPMMILPIIILSRVVIQALTSYILVRSNKQTSNYLGWDFNNTYPKERQACIYALLLIFTSGMPYIMNFIKNRLTKFMVLGAATVYMRTDKTAQIPVSILVSNIALIFIKDFQNALQINIKTAQITYNKTMIFAIISSSIIGLLGYIFADEIISFTWSKIGATDPLLLVIIKQSFKVYMCNLPIIAVLKILIKVHIVFGNKNLIYTASLLQSGCDLFFTIVLGIYYQLGAIGLVYATIIGNTIAVVYIFVANFFNKNTQMNLLKLW